MKARKVPLSEVCEITMGQAPRGESYNTDGQGVALIAGAGDFGTLTPLPKKFTTAATKLSRPDEIILCIRATIGDRNWSDKRYCLGRGVAGLLAKADRLDRQYLWHWLDHATPELKAKGKGATFLQVSKSDIASLEIPLPSLAEQRRIATILDKATALSSACRESEEKLLRLSQSVFLDLFGNPKKSKYPSVPLENVCARITDGAHFTPTYVSDGVPFLRVTDIQSASIEWNSVKRIPLAEHDELIKRCHPEYGDVLYSKNGTIGIPKLIDWELPFSIFVSLALLKPDKEKIRGGYLESFLSTPLAREQAFGHAKTGTVTNLHLVEIRKIKIPLPTLSEQDHWLKIRSCMDRERSRKRTLLKKANEMIASLQHRAFAGTL
ncbi:restriction endonuclease subunit S [Luteibacter sp. PPL554]